MTSPSLSDREALNAGQELDRLVEEISRKVSSGQRVDLDAYVRDYPQHGEGLRLLLPAIQSIAQFGLSISAPSSGVVPASGMRVRGVIGDFRIVREVGCGGMGVVYEAQQVSLGRRVALKVLALAGVLDPKQLKRFKSEAQAAAGLDHPHIVNILSVGCDQDVHYYAMHFIEGWNLAQVIGQFRQLSGLDHPVQQPTDLELLAKRLASGEWLKTPDTRASEAPSSFPPPPRRIPNPHRPPFVLPPSSAPPSNGPSRPPRPWNTRTNWAWSTATSSPCPARRKVCL